MRRRPLVTVAVLAALAAGAIGGARWAYGPLEFPGGLVGPAAGEAGKMAWDEGRGVRGVDAMLVDARRAGTYAFAFDVRNTGRLPLTFDAFEPGEQLALHISDVRISRSEAETAGGGEPVWIPLDGAEVAAGEWRTLRVTVDHDLCREQGRRACPRPSRRSTCATGSARSAGARRSSCPSTSSSSATSCRPRTPERGATLVAEAP